MTPSLFPIPPAPARPADQPWTAMLDALRSKRIQKQLNEWELAFLERQAAQPRHLPLREWPMAQLQSMHRGIFQTKGKRSR